MASSRVVLADVPFAAVPVMVTSYEPGAGLSMASVSVVWPPGATRGGLNDAVTPAGRPMAPSVAVPVNPLTGLRLTVVRQRRARSDRRELAVTQRQCEAGPALRRRRDRELERRRPSPERGVGRCHRHRERPLWTAR